MSTIITRAGKGSALTHNQLDTNFKKAAQAKTGAYTVAESDNRDTIECSGTFTVTMPDVATVVAAADTGDFEVSINNTGTGTITLGRTTGTDTINGAASNFNLSAGDSVILKANQAGNGYNLIASKNGYDISSAGTGASTTLALTSGLGGLEYDFEIRIDSDNASGGAYNIEINSDTTATNYYYLTIGSSGSNSNSISSLASNTAFIVMKGKITIDANGKLFMEYVDISGTDGSATITATNKVLTMTTVETSIDSVELKEITTGGNFKTTSYMKFRKIK